MEYTVTMSKRFFTSDQHIGHKLVSGTRGFDDPKDHDAKLAENWDRVVGPDDIVFVLGDISINPKRDGAFEWFRERPGKKHLIYGNHDEAHPMHSKALQAQQDPNWHETFATMNAWLRLKMVGRTVLLSHFPYEGEGSRDIEDRNVEYRLKDAGFPLLHGHTHAAHQAHLSKAGSHMFHVGVDAWGLELVPESTVQEWLDNIPVVKATS